MQKIFRTFINIMGTTDLDVDSTEVNRKMIHRSTNKDFINPIVFAILLRNYA